MKILLKHSKIEDGNMSLALGATPDVIDNRRRFLEKNGIYPEDCTFMHCPHEDKVRVVRREDAGKGFEKIEDDVLCEALVTTEKNIYLCLHTADCLPISFVDPIKEVVALAHLGWRPTSKLLTKKVVDFLEGQYGSNPADLQINIGPCIHKESYIHEMLEQEVDDIWKPHVHRLASGEISVDLISFNTALLLKAGVLEDNISIHPEDTAKSKEYFSHYRLKRDGQPTKTFLTVIGMELPS